MIEDGYYIVEVDGERTVAEYFNGDWTQLGIDYDVWQYTERGVVPVKLIARINIETLEVVPYVQQSS